MQNMKYLICNFYLLNSKLIHKTEFGGKLKMIAVFLWNQI